MTFRLISVLLSTLIDLRHPLGSDKFFEFPLPPVSSILVFSSSLSTYFEVQCRSQQIITILSQTCPYQCTPLASSNLSTVSCKPNIPISSFVFFLSINLTHIALTILLSVQSQNRHFIFSQAPRFASTQHCWSHTTWNIFLFICSGNLLPLINSPHSLKFTHLTLALAVTAASQPPLALTLSPNYLNPFTVSIPSYNSLTGSTISSIPFLQHSPMKCPAISHGSILCILWTTMGLPCLNTWTKFHCDINCRSIHLCHSCGKQ